MSPICNFNNLQKSFTKPFVKVLDAFVELGASQEGDGGTPLDAQPKTTVEAE